MEKIKHTFEESKNSMSDVRDFFEGLDISQLNEADKIKLYILKDMWADYYFECVSASYCGMERAKKSASLFVMANCITNDTVRAEIIDYTYEYIAELSYEVFDGGEEEEVDKILTESGLLSITDYFKMKEQTKSVNKKDFLNGDKFSVEEYNKMLAALESAGILKKSDYNVVPYKMTLTINPANNGTEN